VSGNSGAERRFPTFHHGPDLTDSLRPSCTRLSRSPRLRSGARLRFTCTVSGAFPSPDSRPHAHSPSLKRRSSSLHLHCLLLCLCKRLRLLAHDRHPGHAALPGHLQLWHHRYQRLGHLLALRGVSGFRLVRHISVSKSVLTSLQRVHGRCPVRRCSVRQIRSPKGHVRWRRDHRPRYDHRCDVQDHCATRCWPIRPWLWCRHHDCRGACILYRDLPASLAWTLHG
jgi:hypothetical protein